VQTDIITKLGLQPDEIEVYHQGIQRPNLRLEAIDVINEDETIKEITEVIDRFKDGSGIIYFSLIKSLDNYSQLLQKKGYKHSVYHGKLESAKRKHIQREFLSGKQKLILATNAFGMGIDKPDIRYVIHAEMPGSIESYYQEIGRAGRDGEHSVCMMLYNSQDLYTQMEFIKWANPDADYYSRIFEMLVNDMDKVLSDGVDYLREQMSFKDRNDFRVETVLSMLDRYGVTEGTVEKRDIKLVTDLPHELEDEDRLKEKLMNDNKKLLSVVKYFNTDNCRRVSISNYFGFPGEKPCGNCDMCFLEK
jgi:ATP-dependent DNA helicase RecQ